MTSQLFKASKQACPSWRTRTSAFVCIKQGPPRLADLGTKGMEEHTGLTLAAAEWILVTMLTLHKPVALLHCIKLSSQLQGLWFTCVAAMGTSSLLMAVYVLTKQQVLRYRPFAQSTHVTGESSWGNDTLFA
eukprot:126092-Pelagomonas_calceolata.AAC.3